MTDKKDPPEADSLLDSLMKLTGNVAGGTLDLARHTATMTAMFGENWLRNALVNTMDPERLEAMAEAGHFLRDAREMAGLSLNDLSAQLGIADNGVLGDVESGETIMPLELMLRCASLLARHDPIPFLIKFMRTYNPTMGQALEQWGVMTLPKQYERERRFINLYRQHDALRGLSDAEYERFIEYMDSSTSLVLDVMEKEKAASKKPRPRKARGASKAAGAAPKPSTKARSKGAASAKKPTASKRGGET